MAVPSQRFGRYVLRELKAKGGMAEIFDADMVGTEGFSKRVALKRMLPHLSDSKSFVDMFLDEARLASRLSHPNVVQVFDFGEVEGRYFISMEYLEGESLSVLVRNAGNKPLPQRVVLQIMAAAADGLHHAHAFVDNGKPLNIVHRDISPSNIMITYQGGVKVLDFGIARAADRQQDATETGIVKGKVPYCSPEQLRGDDLDSRSDIFALGVVLYELLVGKWLFRREKQLDSVLAVLNAEIAPPSSLRPDLDPRLDAVVLKALERDVTKRYQTANELRRDLEALMDGPPVRLDEFMMQLFGAPPTARREELATPHESTGSVVSAASAVDVDLGTAAVGPPKPLLPEKAPPPVSAVVTRPAPPSMLPKLVGGVGALVIVVLVAVVVKLSRAVPTETPVVDAGTTAVVSAPSVVDAGMPVVEAPVVADAGSVAVVVVDAGLPVVRVADPVPVKVKKNPAPVVKAPPAAPGTLDVSCAPWCRIFIDGKDVGQVSPLVGYSLAAGKHSLRVEHTPSGHSADKEVVIEAGKGSKETINLR
jgi:serine/threonine-protein kinase